MTARLHTGARRSEVSLPTRQAVGAIAAAHHVIVLSHTEIRKDNRILKTIEALLSLQGTHVVAIGQKRAESNIPTSGPESQSFESHNVGSGELLLSFRGWIRRKIKLFEILEPLRLFLRTPIRLLTFFYFNCWLVLAALKKADPRKTAIIYCNDDYSLPASVVVAKVTGAKLVYDAHELEHDRNGQSKLERALTLRLEKLCWPFVDYFITVSESIRLHYLQKFGPKPSAVVMNTPSILATHSETPMMSDIRSVVGLGQEDVILLYVGAFSEGRGIRALLDCAKSLPSNHHLVFLGEGALEPHILWYEEELTNVHRVLPVPHETVVSFIATADIGVCLLEPVSLSDRLALPNKFFEYAFAGLPILYTDFPEMSKLAESFDLGRKCDFSVASVIHGVSELKGARTPRKNLEPLSWEHQKQVLRGAISPLLMSR